MLKVLLMLWNGIFLVFCFAKDDTQSARGLPIEAILTKSLAGRWSNRASTLARAVEEESERRGLDPMLVLAVMRTESKFRPNIRGRHGEIGLMQIKPSTARWIAPLVGLPKLSLARMRAALFDPVTNVRYAAAYLAYLRDDVGPSHYVSAYNLGSARVQRELRHSRVPTTYRDRVFANYRRIKRLA